MEKKRLRLSISLKTVVLIFVFASVLIETAMIYFSLNISKNNRTTYMNIANSVSKMTAEVVETSSFTSFKEKVKSIVDTCGDAVLSEEWGSDDWKKYTSHFDLLKEDPDYIATVDFLRKLQTANGGDIECIYVGYVDKVMVRGELLPVFVYVVDAAEKYACPPGCLDILYDENLILLTDPTVGFPAFITNTAEYGYLATSGAPIYVGGEVVGYAMSDVSMSKVRAAQANNVVTLFLFLFATMIGISIIGIVAIHFILIKPIKTLNNTAKAYDSDDPEKTHQLFKELDIYTHDELYDLMNSLKNMEDDAYNKMNELTNMNEQLLASQQVAAKMTELANKDGLTGVRNKVAYDKVVNRLNGEIKEGKVENFGIAMVDLNYLKVINDQYGHDSGDIALIKLSNLICTYFAHSPVFRVGGDEFVVILRNNDLHRVDKIISDFNEKIKELDEDSDLKPEEKVSAAIGYAKYDASIDKNVDDVFKRADQAMYNRKREMKKPHNK